ncbi:MAG TPA: hypothetical protein VGJ01_08615 [Pseudolabrys sp.]
MRLASAAVAILTLATQARAEPREITGQAGVLGEWELSAAVTEQSVDGAKELRGPLTLKHVGICTQDGPEEKTGTLRLRLSDSSRRVDATLLIEGAECTFTGNRTNSFDGVMNCPDRRGVPLMLWIK